LPGMSTPSKGLIYIHTIWPDSRRLHRCDQHHRNVVNRRIIRHPALLPKQTHPSLALPDQQNHRAITVPFVRHRLPSPTLLFFPNYKPTLTHFLSPHTLANLSVIKPSLPSPTSAL